jgi:hypothetical protein
MLLIEPIEPIVPIGRLFDNYDLLYCFMSTYVFV